MPSDINFLQPSCNILPQIITKNATTGTGHLVHGPIEGLPLPTLTAWNRLSRENIDHCMSLYVQTEAAKLIKG